MLGNILNDLYNYEYFGFYVIVAIILLVILFLVILFYGKKDKNIREIEATKKLQQINDQAFKVEDNSVPLDTPANEVENTIIMQPVNEDVAVNNVEPIINNETPQINNIDDSNNIDNNGIVEENNNSLNEITPVVETPSIEQVVENVPVPEEIPVVNNEVDEIPMVNEQPNIEVREETPEIPLPELNIEPIMESPDLNINDSVDNNIVVEPEIDFSIPNVDNNENVDEKESPVLEPIDVPEFNFNDVAPDTYNINESINDLKDEIDEVEEVKPKVEMPKVFSSVFVPEQEEKEIEIPKEVEKNAIDEDEDFELPALKK